MYCTKRRQILCEVKMKTIFVATFVTVLVAFASAGDPPKCLNDEKLGVELLSNPDDCGSYYACSNGIPYAMVCPEGLEFNPHIRVCDWPLADPKCIRHHRPTRPPRPTGSTDPTRTPGPTESSDSTTPGPTESSDSTTSSPTVSPDSTTPGPSTSTDTEPTSTSSWIPSSSSSQSTTVRPPVSTTRRPWWIIQWPTLWPRPTPSRGPISVN